MPQAKVLRLLRYDAKHWWYFQDLRKWGRNDEAAKLERESIRNKVEKIRTLRELLEEIHVSSNTFTFKYPEYKHTQATVSISGCHPGFFAAFIYCYANRIGKTK